MIMLIIISSSIIKVLIWISWISFLRRRPRLMANIGPIFVLMCWLSLLLLLLSLSLSFSSSSSSIIMISSSSSIIIIIIIIIII